MAVVALLNRGVSAVLPVCRGVVPPPHWVLSHSPRPSHIGSSSCRCDVFSDWWSSDVLPGQEMQWQLRRRWPHGMPAALLLQFWSHLRSCSLRGVLKNLETIKALCSVYHKSAEYCTLRNRWQLFQEDASSHHRPATWEEMDLAVHLSSFEHSSATGDGDVSPDCSSAVAMPPPTMASPAPG